MRKRSHIFNVRVSNREFTLREVVEEIVYNVSVYVCVCVLGCTCVFFCENVRMCLHPYVCVFEFVCVGGVWVCAWVCVSEYDLINDHIHCIVE